MKKSWDYPINFDSVFSEEQQTMIDNGNLEDFKDSLTGRQIKALNFWLNTGMVAGETRHSPLQVDLDTKGKNQAKSGTPAVWRTSQRIRRSKLWHLDLMGSESNHSASADTELKAFDSWIIETRQ